MFTVKWQPSQRGHHKKLSVGRTRSIKKFNASKRKLDTPSTEQDIPMLKSYLPFHGARHSYAQVISTLPWSKTFLCSGHIYPSTEQDSYAQVISTLPRSKTFLCSGHIYPSMEQDIPMLRSYLPFHGARHSYAQVISTLPWSKTFLCSGHIYPSTEQDIPMLRSYLPFHGARHSYAQVISTLHIMEQDIPTLPRSKTFLCSGHICGISMS